MRDVVVEQRAAARGLALVERRQVHAGGRGVLVADARQHDHAVALLGGEHQPLRRARDPADGLAALEPLQHVRDVLEADQQVVDDWRVARLVDDPAQDPGGDERRDHEAPPPRPLGIEHQVVGEDGGDLVAVEVEPAAVRAARISSPTRSASGSRGQHDRRTLRLGEGPRGLGRLEHLRVRRAERDRGEAAVGSLGVRHAHGKAEPLQQVAHRVEAAAAQRREDDGDVRPGAKMPVVELLVEVEVDGVCSAPGSAPPAACARRLFERQAVHARWRSPSRRSGSGRRARSAGCRSRRRS